MSSTKLQKTSSPTNKIAKQPTSPSKKAD